MPIAGGSLIHRVLMQPISTASASTMARRSTGWKVSVIAVADFTGVGRIESRTGTMPAPFAIRYSGAALPCKLAAWELPHVRKSWPVAGRGRRPGRLRQDGADGCAVQAAARALPDRRHHQRHLHQMGRRISGALGRAARRAHHGRRDRRLPAHRHPRGRVRQPRRGRRHAGQVPRPRPGADRIRRRQSGGNVFARARRPHHLRHRRRGRRKNSVQRRPGHHAFGSAGDQQDRSRPPRRRLAGQHGARHQAHARRAAFHLQQSARRLWRRRNRPLHRGQRRARRVMNDPLPASGGGISMRETSEPGGCVMARELHRVKIAPKGMGLNDFVAMQEGFFAAEGLDVELDWKTFRGTQSSWKNLDYLHRPQDRPYTEDKVDVIQGACVWGSICNASAGMGRFVADAYGVSPWAIFVRPDSRIRAPQDLKDVPISVGMRAGSHFNVPYRLEKFLALEHIKTVNTGGFGARLKALLDGEVEAASLLPPQIAMAEQLGLRKIIEDTFHTLWWVPDGSPPEVVTGYLRALDRAEKAMDADLEKYLPLWKLAVPVEFETTHAWDFTRFGRGERFVYEPIPRSEFDEVMDQVKRWGLDDYLKDREFENLAAEVAR